MKFMKKDLFKNSHTQYQQCLKKIESIRKIIKILNIMLFFLFISMLTSYILK